METDGLKTQLNMVHCRLESLITTLEKIHKRSEIDPILCCECVALWPCDTIREAHSHRYHNVKDIV